jgi:transcriptional regulator with GAF, ATPase, and Fis domain
MDKIKKANQSLPTEVVRLFNQIIDPTDRDNLIRKLHNAGWTQSSIARSIDLTRERVRQICVMENDPIGQTEFTIPMPPSHEIKAKREFIEPDSKSLARLLELQPMAKQVRSHATRFRAEAEEYTALIAKLHEVDGVTLYRLALRLGVTHSALRFRLARYGYKLSDSGVSKVYQPINPKNRVR